MMDNSLLFNSCSSRFNDLIELALCYATSDKSILLRGDTGTGKELIAELIYKCSCRSDKSYKIVNIAAFNDNLFESEVFGHEEGSFTGAGRLKIGALEDADDGTIFLDEIGNLSVHTQAKLLRVLDNRKFQRVGGTKDINFKARVISATSKNLEQMIEDGTFSRDLYHRFNVQLAVPSLRERCEDIPNLVKHFIENEIKNALTPVPKWYQEKHSECLSLFLMQSNYHWPGNIRQLKNIVGDVFERCVRNGAEEDFKLGVKKIIRVNCAKEAGNDQINHLLSNIAYEHLSGYKEGDPPLREVVDDILVKAIGCGLDMALIGGRFKPASMLEVGKAMGIQSLVNKNRALLPLDRDGKDYILTTLRSLSPSNDCYPKAFNEVLQRC